MYADAQQFCRFRCVGTLALGDIRLPPLSPDCENVDAAAFLRRGRGRGLDGRRPKRHPGGRRGRRLLGIVLFIRAGAIAYGTAAAGHAIRLVCENSGLHSLC
jgi:hypothetical protein